jgi:hypothetical protein
VGVKPSKTTLPSHLGQADMPAIHSLQVMNALRVDTDQRNSSGQALGHHPLYEDASNELANFA